MKLYVAAFPNFAAQATWISDIRSKYDPVAKYVMPHLTLIFPTASFTAEELRHELSQLVRGFAPFRVALRSAILMPESASPSKHAHIFLVPDEGFGQMVRLHDRLYTGKLASELRLDIPFVPHMTVGADLDLTNAKTIADDLNSSDFEIRFDLNELFIVEITEQNADRRIGASIPLG